MFDTLSDRLGSIFDKLRGQASLSEDDVSAAMREVRVALLEGRVSAWDESLPPADDVLEIEEEASFRVVGDRLYLVDVVPMGLFGRLLGSVLLGRPLDESAGRRLADPARAPPGG